MSRAFLMLILCLGVLTVYNGCARNLEVKLYPQTPEDIYQDDKGFTCVSPKYMQEVMKVRLGD